MPQEPQGASDHLKLPTTTMESVTEDQQKVEDIVPPESDSGLATNSIFAFLNGIIDILEGCTKNFSGAYVQVLERVFAIYHHHTYLNNSVNYAK